MLLVFKKQLTSTLRAREATLFLYKYFITPKERRETYKEVFPNMLFR